MSVSRLPPYSTSKKKKEKKKDFWNDPFDHFCSLPLFPWDQPSLALTAKLDRSKEGQKETRFKNLGWGEFLRECGMWGMAAFVHKRNKEERWFFFFQCYYHLLALPHPAPFTVFENRVENCKFRGLWSPPFKDYMT